MIDPNKASFRLVVISIDIPQPSEITQSFPYTVRTYVPYEMSLEAARAYLIESVYKGAIAHLMESTAIEESAALRIITRKMIKLEFD